MRVLYLEPFDGGSHAAFTRALTLDEDGFEWTRLCLPARHWKWRMRSCAVYYAREHAEQMADPGDLVFASSYVPLAELVGLCPALAAVPKVLYFHENQLTFPVRAGRPANLVDRDTHFGFTQMVSALAADLCLFNSRHNLEAFVEAAGELLARMPDAVPPGWVEAIRSRSEVLGLPVELPETEGELRDLATDDPERTKGPLLLWNHRWEHDKGPDEFFDVLADLRARGVPFRLAVCGQRFRRQPDSFERGREALADRIEHWGFAADREAYVDLLRRAQVVLSTAQHEFFGVSVVEASHAGAFALVPDRLAYPERFPDEHRYGPGELTERLEGLCRRWAAGEIDLRADRRGLTEGLAAGSMRARYRERLRRLVAERVAG